MTWYLGVTPMQEPFDVGLDELARAQCGFNVIALMRPSATFCEELATRLEAAGVGRRGENIFISGKATIPPGPGPYLSVRATGGTAPLGTHNEGRGAYRRPAAQILVRAATWAAAAAMADAAYTVLVGVTNRALTA